MKASNKSRLLYLPILRVLAAIFGMKVGGIVVGQWCFQDLGGVLGKEI